MEKPSLLKSQIFDYWVASCDIGSIGLAICTGSQFKLLNHDGSAVWDKTLGASTSIGFFSKYGPKIIIGCWDGTVRQFDFEGILEKEITFTYPVYAESENGDTLIACVGQYVVALNEQWKEKWRYKMPFYIKSCDIGQEGQLVVGSQAGPEGGAVAQLKSDGTLIWKKKFSTNVLAVRYIKCQGDECIVLGTRGGFWSVLAGSDGTEIHSVKHKGSVLCVEKAPGGFLLGGRDKKLRKFEMIGDKISESWSHKFADVVYCCSLKKIEDVLVNLLVGTLDHHLHYFGAN